MIRHAVGYTGDKLPSQAILREILDGREWAIRIFAEQFILLLVTSCAEAEATLLSLTGQRTKDLGERHFSGY